MRVRVRSLATATPLLVLLATIMGLMPLVWPHSPTIAPRALAVTSAATARFRHGGSAGVPALVRTQPSTSSVCPWYDESSTSISDLNSGYWVAPFQADPSVSYTITGTFPADRYTSFQLYSSNAAPLGELLDVNFPPDPGSVNPLLAGTQRGVGTYTLHLVMGPPPAQPLSNTIYASVPPTATLDLFYRVYLPDTGATASGNVPLPVLSAHNSSDGSDVPCPPPLTILRPQPPSSLPPVGAFTRWQYNSFPNNDAAYVATTLAVTSTLYVVRFQAPTTPHTLAGGPEDLTAQLRYWSVCIYDAATVDPLTCPPDEEVPQDQNGLVTLVMGATGAQPGNATAANGVQWIDLGQFAKPDLAVIRNLIPASDFPYSAFAVPAGAPAATYMGTYAPIIVQCSTAQFEADECLSVPTPTPLPSATPTTPPSTATPTPTATPISATIAISPAIVYPFQSIALTGAAFLPGEPVGVYWDTTTTAPLSTSAAGVSGTFSLTVRAPQAADGAHQLIALGRSDGRMARATARIKPLAILSASSGHAGASDVLAGFGFGARETVKAYWLPGGIPLGPAGGTATTSLGTFAGATALTFTVPISPAGTYAIYAVGQHSKGVAIHLFTLTPSRATPPGTSHGLTLIAVGGKRSGRVARAPG